MGSPWAFLFAVGLIVVWLVTGPLFHFSDTWQLVINTGTTIVTFLMVFVIPNTQNRDAKALHIKLDELLRSIHGARVGFIDLEHLSDQEINQLEQEFRKLRERSTLRRTARGTKAGRKPQMSRGYWQSTSINGRHGRPGA